jgi:hypothetical protein
MFNTKRLYITKLLYNKPVNKTKIAKTTNYF